VFSNLRYKVVALLAALLLWGVSHSTSSVERGFDIPVVTTNEPAELVITGRNTDSLNIRVRATPAALRRLSVADLTYPVDLAGARAGTTKHEVDQTAITLPRGAQIVSRSPASLEFTLERRSTRAVKVRADIDGDPAQGFVVGDVTVEPTRLRISGPRSEVLRLAEVLTETIDVAGANSTIERKVKAMPGGLHVRIDGDPEVTVRIPIQPAEPEEAATSPATPRRRSRS
jgi:YbbR domain-containing protein